NTPFFVLRGGPFLGCVEADSEDLARGGIDGFKPPAGRVHDAFAARRYVSGEEEYQATERVDLVLFPGKARVHGSGQFFELDAGIRLPQPVFEESQHSDLLDVVLVLDIADDL